MDKNTFEHIIEDAKECLQPKNISGALFIALAIPDICGNIESRKNNDNLGVHDRYVNWYKKYINNEDTELIIEKDKSENDQYNLNPIYDGNLIYLIRCSLLHEGKTQLIPDKEYGNWKSIKEKIPLNIKLSIFDGTSLVTGASASRPGHGGYLNERKALDLHIDTKKLCNLLIDNGKKYFDNNKPYFMKINNDFFNLTFEI